MSDKAPPLDLQPALEETFLPTSVQSLVADSDLELERRHLLVSVRAGRSHVAGGLHQFNFACVPPPVMVILPQFHRTIAGLASLARLAQDTARFEHAGLLWGAVEAVEAARAGISWAVDRPAWEKAVVGGGGSDFDEAREQGRRLSLDEALAYALQSDT